MPGPITGGGVGITYTGTANQIIVTGSVLSTPQNIATTSDTAFNTVSVSDTANSGPLWTIGTLDNGDTLIFQLPSLLLLQLNSAGAYFGINVATSFAFQGNVDLTGKTLIDSAGTPSADNDIFIGTEFGPAWTNATTYIGNFVPAIPGLTTYAAYASGTIYTLTATDAFVNFGTNDPTITIVDAGTYLLMGRAYVKYNAATYASTQTVTIHLRKESGTPADITNATTTETMRIITTITDSVGAMSLPPIVYTASPGDVISVYGSVSATPAAGSVQVGEASIIAIKIA